MRPRHLIGSLFLALCACASGATRTTTIIGNSGARPSIAPFSFQDFAAEKGDATLGGYSREASFTRDANGKFTSISAPTNFRGGAYFSYRREYGWNNLHTAENTEPYFTSSYWDYDDEVGRVASDARLQFIQSPGGWNQGQVADPYALGWHYQTFGIWNMSDIYSGGTIGAFTVGAPTAANAVPPPATGSMSYSGLAAGNYIAGDGTRSLARADMTLLANFEHSNFGLSLSNSQVLSQAGSWVASPNLNLSGTLSGAAATNGFAGTVSTTGGGAGNSPLSGTANGLFYGPTGDEVGGIFWVSGGGVTTYSGGFGGKR